MPDFTNPVGSTQRYIAALNRLQNDRIPGTKKICVDHNDLTQKVDEERSCVGMGLPVWFDGVDIQVKTEPAAVGRRWSLSTGAGTPSGNAAASHARTVVIGVFSRVLAADTNRVRDTTGAPASGVGANGDLALDSNAGVIYEKAAGAWSVVVSMFGGGGASPTVPGAPTIGTASAGNGTVSVAFTAPSSNGGAAIIDYTVTLSTGQTATGSSSPISVTAPNGTAVTATVRARNSVGQGTASAASNSVTPSAGVTAPGAPTIGTATAGDGSATVTFTAPASNGGATITGYRVTASTGQTATGSASPITVTGLTNGTAATFTVQAQNSVGYGTASAASNSVTPAAAGGGSASPLRMTGLSKVIESGDSTSGWNYVGDPAETTSSYSGFAITSQQIAANGEGYAEYTMPGGGVSTAILGFKTGGAIPTTPTSFYLGVQPIPGTRYARQDNGVSGTNNGASLVPAPGHVVRLRRASVGGGTFNTLLEVSTDNRATWTVIHTWAGSLSAASNIAMAFTNNAFPASNLRSVGVA